MFASFLGGYIPAPPVVPANADLSTAALVVVFFLGLAIAISASLVYFTRPKATPQAKPVTPELRKAA